MKLEDEEEKAEDDAADAEGGVDELIGAVVTWLTVERDFSVGRPCLSKYLSAAWAICSAVMVSTSLPIYSLMRAGRLLRTCSLYMWSISTSFVSSLSCRRN